jgi:hypothetical protein
MNMIGHKAICPNLNLCLSRLLSQQIAVDLMVTVLKKERLSPVPTLCDVMR